MYKFFLFLIVGFHIYVQADAQPIQPIRDFNTILQKMDSNRFEMIYTIATTHYNYYLEPTTPYNDQNIRIAKDSAFIIVHDSIASGYLPYYGGGYSIPQTGKKGIVFNGKMYDQKMKTKGRGRKRTINYQFTIVGMNDTYKISIDVQKDGTCYLYVASLRRSPISYTGQMVEKVI